MKQVESLLDLLQTFNTEQKCIDYLTFVRWNKKPVCPHCGYVKTIYKFSDNKRFKCGKCYKQFTVRIRTIFEDSKLPLKKWFIAFYLVTNHKKGVSSLQLAKDINVTQKTAWFMLQRIQHLAQIKDKAPLQETIEGNETKLTYKEQIA